MASSSSPMGAPDPMAPPRVPDWIAAIGRESAEQAADAQAPRPSWISALGLSETGSPDGFRETSLFGAAASAPPPEEPQEPVAEPESAAPDEDAYMRGYAEGHAEAKRLGDAAMAESEARYRELRAAVRALDAAALEALTQDLNATVLALCEQVLGDFAVDADALAQRCRSAAKRLSAGPGALTLHLHPETLARLDPDAFAGWTVAEDAALAPGALRLSNAEGAVRDGPEDWMRAFADALRA